MLNLSCICICTCAASRKETTRRRWTEEEKLRILQEAALTSVMAASRMFQIHPRLIFEWKRKLSSVNESCLECKEPVLA